jgi:hypothetical protein
MGGLNSSMLAIVTALAVAGVGWAAIHTIRAGFDYISARGNPRNRGQAHETLFDIGKGALLIGGAAAIAAFGFATIKFG